jgi:hypothetical protein
MGKVWRLATKSTITSGISPITQLKALLIYGSRTDGRKERSVKGVLLELKILKTISRGYEQSEQLRLPFLAETVAF